MTLKKIRVIATLFSALISIGCSGEGVFENPDSIRVTTLEAIHGKRGHLINVNISKDINGVTKQAVLEIWDKEVSDATLYVVIESGNTGIGGMIDLLKNATRVAIVPDLPENTKPWTRLVLTFGDGSGDPFAGYLQITAPTGIEYLSLRGTVTQERRDWFLTEITKPPKVLDTMPATVTSINYYRDSALTMPIVNEIVVGGTVYTKVVFSKDVPAVVANDMNAQPSISSATRATEFQYRVRPRSADLQSGDAAPYQNTANIFVCKYVVQTGDFGGLFSTYVGTRAQSGAALRVTLFTYTGEIPANTGETITDWHPDDFVGQVYTIDSQTIHTNYTQGNVSRSLTVAVAGAAVTIVSGARSNESIFTDKNGRYRFRNVTENSLHLRVEKPHFEPKKVLVHRSRPTSPSDGSTPNYNGDTQKEPGNILIGQAWPEEVRILLKEVLLVHDLLFIEAEKIPKNSTFAGIYGSGLVVTFTSRFLNSRYTFEDVVRLLEHEIAHAHQHAVVAVDGSGHLRSWIHSPEGRAYAEAKRKDVEVLGEKMYYDVTPYYASDILENSAEHCAAYWRTRRGEEPGYQNARQLGKTLEELAPNRFRWAEEWLNKK